MFESLCYGKRKINIKDMENIEDFEDLEETYENDKLIKIIQVLEIKGLSINKINIFKGSPLIWLIRRLRNTFEKNEEIYETSSLERDDLHQKIKRSQLKSLVSIKKVALQSIGVS